MYSLAVIALRYTLGWRVVEFPEGRPPRSDFLPGTLGLCHFLRRTVYLQEDTTASMTRVVLHELAHVLTDRRLTDLASGFEKQAAIRASEQLAEGVSTLICDLAGLNIRTHSVPYLAGWGLAEAPRSLAVSNIVDLAKSVLWILVETNERCRPEEAVAA